MKKSKHRYHWQGVDHQGVRQKGVIEAFSVALVKQELGNLPIRVKKIRKKNDFIFNSRIKQAHITLFSRQLATMLKAGIPLIQAFDFVANCQTNHLIKSLIVEIKADVEQGLTFSETLHRHPKFFNELFCNLIAVGEKSGKLDMMLDKVADYKEKIESIKKKLQKALAYPFLVLLISSFVTVAILIFVVPQFESLFTGFGAELPALTQVIINVSILLKNYWLEILVILSALIGGFIKARQRLSWLNYASDKIILRLPIIGPLFSKTIIARFARTLAIGFEAGLPLVEALGAVAGVTGNKVFTQATERIKIELFNGQPLQLAMQNTQLFPTMAVQLVAIGEESGTLELMLQKIADFYEEEVNTRLDISINLLEPIIMAILGLIIGTLVIAMYLPIFKLGSVV
ncbi:MAG: type II secretion system F family protein [Tatlockia sp.]|nr:type II secretion system F family protein [Tatlockia sp.]